MELTVKERLVLLNVLPAQGDITTLKIVRQLREELSFSEEEHKKLNLEQTEDGGVRWNSNITKEVRIGDKAMDVIANSLKERNEKKQLNIDHLDVYERFVEKKEEL